MPKPERLTHLIAAIVFTILALAAAVFRPDVGLRWSVFRTLSLASSGLAWLLFFRTRRRDRDSETGEDTTFIAYPEGQARLIDSGRLPNRYNPRIILHEFEACHFSIQARRIIFAPLPDADKIDPARLAVRLSGGQFYYILRPQEILLPAEVEQEVSGELIITSQRILFLAKENAVEAPLQRLKMLDCSAHLVDFQVKNRRYTIQTDAAGYAEKVLMLLLARPES